MKLFWCIFVGYLLDICWTWCVRIVQSSKKLFQEAFKMKSSKKFMVRVLYGQERLYVDMEDYFGEIN